MLFTTKGQGATEYLVLLAVVLMIALVSLALLGFFPGMAGDAKKSESDTYWKSARPFGILSHTIASGTGIGSLTIQNNGIDMLTITTIDIATCPYSGGSVTLNAGEKRTISPAVVCTSPGSSGAVYEFSTNITYNTPNLSGLKQLGTKSLVGKYT